MKRLEKVDVPGAESRSDNVFQETIYRSVARSFQIENIISNVNLVYDDIGMSGMDDDVFIDGSQNNKSEEGEESSSAGTDNGCLSLAETEITE